jgi:hypothetical protein
MRQGSHATLDREKEKLWFPVLTRHGFTDLQLSPDEMDQENAIDAEGYDAQGEPKSFALRSRDVGRYRPAQLAEYKQQFTIRYARPRTEEVEWQKLFEMGLEVVPNYFVYGWCNRARTAIDDYVIMDVHILRQLYDQGYLERFYLNTKVNTDWRKSTLLYIPIPELLSLPGTSELIVYHSENHPALAWS